ncbi:MAG: hypothetical protein ABI598_04775, partial [Chloroflexota bacterium]
MTPLGHPEAHELLLDLALEPSALAQVVQATLGGPALPDGDPLVAHLQACAICQEQLVAWTRTHAAVREALHQAGSAVPQRLEPWDEDTRILPPPDLRAHVLEAARTASMTSTVAGLVGPDLETTSARTRLPALTSITQGRRF